VTVDFRPIEPDELYEFASVNLTAFGERLDPWHESWFQRRREQSVTMAAFETGQMVGSSMFFPVEVAVPGAVVTAAGVTAVGVLPTHRRQGVMRGMMDRLLLQAKESGLSMAALWASEGGIYSRFGFGPAAQSLRIDLEHPKASLVPAVRSGQMTLVSVEIARRLFPPVHAQLVQQRPGMVGRDQIAWDYALSDDDPLVPREESHLFLLAHDSGDGCDGYLIYRIRGAWSPRGPEGTLLITEMVGSSPRATADMWRYCTEVDLIRRIEASGRGCRPVDDPLLWLAQDPQAVVSTMRTTIWCRVLDPRALLERRRYQRDGDLTLHLDPSLDEPGITWHLTVRDGVGSCQPSAGQADITMGWSDFGALCLGRRCLTQLVGAGRVRPHSPDIARRAEELLAWEPQPWCFEDI